MNLVYSLFRKYDELSEKTRLIVLVAFVFCGQMSVFAVSRFLMIPWMAVLVGLIVLRFMYLNQKK